MAKEVKVKAWKSANESLVIAYTNMSPFLQKMVDKLNYQENFDLTFSVPDPRGDWIKKWYKKAKKDNGVVFRHHKTVTICIPRWHVSDDGFGISDVCKGDTYDRKTGIAVAYAKHCGESIPDFI